MKHVSLLIAGVAAAATIVALPAVASAAPKSQTTVTVDCEGTANDGPVTVGASSGTWTPAFRGHTVFVPVEFGEFHGSYTPAGGAPQYFTDPPAVQNANKAGVHERLACDYHVYGEDASGGVFQGDGSVVVAIVGKL